MYPILYNVGTVQFNNEYYWPSLTPIPPILRTLQLFDILLKVQLLREETKLDSSGYSMPLASRGSLDLLLFLSPPPQFFSGESTSFLYLVRIRKNSLNLYFFA